MQIDLGTESTITAAELNRTPGKAKRKAYQGPVIITENGEPTHVLLSHRDYLLLLRYASERKTDA